MDTRFDDDSMPLQERMLSHPLLAPEEVKKLFVELEKAVGSYKELLLRSLAYPVILKDLVKKRRYDISAYLSAEGKKNYPFSDFAIDSPSVIDKLLRKNRLTVRFVVDTQEVIEQHLNNGLFPQDRIALASLQREAQTHVKKALAARDVVLLHNLRLANDIARRYAPKRQDADDYFQECLIGLMRAIDLFDHRRGLRFSTYATEWLKQAASHHLMNAGIIHVPTHAQEKLRKARRASSMLGQRLGRMPTQAELARELGIPTKKIEKQLGWALDINSLGTAVKGYKNVTLEDTLTASADIEADIIKKEEDATKLATVEKTLDDIATTERDGHRKVAMYRAYLLRDETTLASIGGKYGVTRERIRQVVAYVHQELLLRLGIENTRHWKAKACRREKAYRDKAPESLAAKPAAKPATSHTATRTKLATRRPSTRRMLRGIETDNLERFLQSMEASSKVNGRDLAIFRAYSTGEGRYNARQIAKVHNISTPQVYAILRKIGEELKSQLPS